MFRGITLKLKKERSREGQRRWKKGGESNKSGVKGCEKEGRNEKGKMKDNEGGREKEGNVFSDPLLCSQTPKTPGREAEQSNRKEVVTKMLFMFSDECAS